MAETGSRGWASHHMLLLLLVLAATVRAQLQQQPQVPAAQAQNNNGVLGQHKAPVGQSHDQQQVQQHDQLAQIQRLPQKALDVQDKINHGQLPQLPNVPGGDGQVYKRVGNVVMNNNNAVPGGVVPKADNKLPSVNKEGQVAANRLADNQLHKDSGAPGALRQDNVQAAVVVNPQITNRDTANNAAAGNGGVQAPVDQAHRDSNANNVVKKFEMPKNDNKMGDKNSVVVGGGSFDAAAKVPKLPDTGNADNQNNLKPLTQDSINKKAEENVDKQSAGQLDGKDVPVNVKVIYGDKEKNKGAEGNDIDEGEDEEEEDDDDEYVEDEDDANENSKVGQEQLDAVKIPQMPNEIPQNGVIGGVENANGNGFAGPNQDVPKKHESNEGVEKPGSLKVVWDWSDFAVNFEQYIMPEQKIRRAPHATTGEPWPMPQYYVTKPDKVYRIDRASFRFKLSKIKCDIIEKALERYKPYIVEDAVEDMYDNFQHSQSTMFDDPSLKYEKTPYVDAPVIAMVSVKIRKPCAKFPTPKSDETYDLFVKRTGVHIWANEVWGALRGLETFSQLVFKGSNQNLYVRDTVINDYPRFSHRGVMVDSSRHFMFKETIYDILEGMAQNKMNVMHWHLVDDQSFPFYSQAYPDLSAKGAFHPTFVYMPSDIIDIIEFARLRGIRVEPEFDTPGHTYSWGLSRPDLLTQCYQGDHPVDGYLGPMDPSKNETFRFLKNFFKDVLHVFKDEYIHLGGDEVPMTCWQSNPEVTKFLAKLEGRADTPQSNDPYYYSYDIRKVLEYYVTRLIGDLKSLGSKRSNGVRFVFWQEIMNNNVQLPNDTIIHVWQGGMEDVQRATSLGLNVIYSTCWYLDLIEYGTKWSKYYQCDPADTTYGFSIDESQVLGGEACLWAEYIDNENAMTTLWPRASAAAERLWSNKEVRDLDSAAARLQEHRCRMLSRGLGVGQISGPDYCLRRGKRRHQVNETSASNCTYSQCASYNENSRFEVEKIKVEFEQKGGRMLDCSQAVIHAGSQLTVVLLLIIVVAVLVTLKFSKQKIVHVRMCKNKSILVVFVTIILLYFFCYVTSIWMQAMEFKGSFEKRISSNVQPQQH